jgi:hypothetical protein
VNVNNPTSLDTYEDPGGKIKQSKCQNLRLDYHTDTKHISGHPHARIVCVKQNGQCACVKGLKAVNAQVTYGQALTYQEREKKIAAVAVELTPELLAEQARAARQAKRASMGEVANIQRRAERSLLAELQGGNTAAWFAVLDALSWTSAANLTKKGLQNDRDAILEKIADAVIGHMMPDSYTLEQSRDPAQTTLDRINRKLNECGLPTLTMMDFGDKEEAIPADEFIKVDL